MISWTVRKPELLRYELEQIHLAFPGFEPLSDAWANNVLALSGSLKFRMDGKTKTVRILLRFDDDHPHAPPRVIPLDDGAPDESRVSKEGVRWFSARHQMADGSICLFELPGTSGKSRHVSGRDALSRTERWLRSVLRGEFPAGIDIERVAMGEHYQGIGDVLLGPAAWGPLDETGAFFAVNARGAEELPLPLYVVSRWAGDSGATKTEHKLLPWFEQDAPTAGQTWEAILGDPSVSIPAVLAGRYYTLAAEPPPVRDVRQLAKLVFPDEADPYERLRRDFAVERLRARALAIALRLPDRDGEVEWVFFFLRLRERELERESVTDLPVPGIVLDFDNPHDPLEHASLEILRTHDLRRRTFLLRNGEDLLSGTGDMQFVLAGAGALGSACADLLAKAGVGALELWDSQLLESGNVVRHVAPLGNVGLPKAFLVSAHVQHRAPHCEATFRLASVLERGGGGGPFGRGWPILSTIANDATELALNEHAVRAGVTVFYLRALRRGTVGRLIRVRPGEDACLECIARYQKAGEHRLVSVEAAEDEVISHECGNAVLAASAADLTIVAGFAVRTLLHLEEETPDNHWLWATEEVPDHPELTTSFSKSVFRLDPHRECSVCGGPPVTKVILPETRAKMEQLAGETAPNETGGILIGSREGQTVEVLAVSGPGPNAISTPVKFIRDGKFCAEFLKEAVAAHPGADYVGEWHSHPNGDVRPSGRDVASLLDVAEDPNFLTECPVMVILGAPASPDISATAFPVERAPVQLAVTAAPDSDVDVAEERGGSDVG